MTILTPSIESRKSTLYQMFLEVVDKWAKSNDTEVVKGYRTFGHHLGPMVQSVISMFEELRYASNSRSLLLFTRYVFRSLLTLVRTSAPSWARNTRARFAWRRWSSLSVALSGSTP